jgi:hypothetical protein
MNLPQEKKKRFDRFWPMAGKLFFIILAVSALVALPYRFNHQKGSYVSSVVLAEDGGGEGGDHDGAGDSNGGHDGDQDTNGSGHDIGDDQEEGGSHDIGEDQDESEDHDIGEDHQESNETEHAGDTQAGQRDDSNEQDKGANGINSINGLTPVSPQEEAGLVGNWGDSANK